MLRKVASRVLIISSTIISCAIGLYIILKVFQDNIVLYITPTEVLNLKDYSARYRLGGVVKAGSIEYLENGALAFIITDGKKELPVLYSKIVPSLFRENQEAVVYGEFDGKIFYGKELLAKHDENYKPKN